MIAYLKGDATDPVCNSPTRIIIHCCNDIGVWGAGFVLALSRKWPHVETAYRVKTKYLLGSVEFVEVKSDLHVANMIGQRGCGERPDGTPPIDYPAIRACLIKVREKVEELGGGNQVSVHGPRFGAGLAGGDWSVIEQILVEELCMNGISVTIYDL